MEVSTNARKPKQLSFLEFIRLNYKARQDLIFIVTRGGLQAFNLYTDNHLALPLPYKGVSSSVNLS